MQLYWFPPSPDYWGTERWEKPKSKYEGKIDGPNLIIVFRNFGKNWISDRRTWKWEIASLLCNSGPCKQYFAIYINHTIQNCERRLLSIISWPLRRSSMSSLRIIPGKKSIISGKKKQSKSIRPGKYLRKDNWKHTRKVKWKLTKLRMPATTDTDQLFLNPLKQWSHQGG